jgi:protein TonB
MLPSAHELIIPEHHHLTPRIGSTHQRLVEHPLIYTYHPVVPPTGPLHQGEGGSVGKVWVAPKTTPPQIPPIAISGPDHRDIVDNVPMTWDTTEGRQHTGGIGQQSPTGVFSSDVVDVQVTPYPGAPTPRYPEALREAGIEGEVTLEFVVDTTGRVDHESVRVLSSASDAFVVSVRDALVATRYHPALVGGQRVRQLVRQGFVFSLTQH